MELWKGTEELKIIYENEDVDEKQVKYPLYYTNFKYALNNIFHLSQDYYKTARNNGGRVRENTLGNIFTFMGSRGSGKTTAMGEFCEILEKMSNPAVSRYWIDAAGDEEFISHYQNETFHFIVLNAIDASLLGEKEDLFEVILVKIYYKFKKLIARRHHCETPGSAKISLINQTFEKTLQMYRSIRGQIKEADYSITSLGYSLGSGNEIRENISELADMLFELDQYQYDYEYLVIAIDDLDLNLVNGYEMLEQLQKYFSYYKIIILTAVDYEQMHLVCAEYFHKKMKNVCDESRVDGYDMHSRKLANNHMTKVFPLSRRIFMRDEDKLKNIQIALTDGKLDMKRFVIAKIYEAMKISYDMCGVKKHFSEPANIRNLVTYNDFLNRLNKIDYRKLTDYRVIACMSDSAEKEKKLNKNILAAYDQNHERFNWEIVEKQAHTMMHPEAEKLFKRLFNYDLERRPAQFVKMAEDQLYGNLSKYPAENVENIYTYGLFLKEIYHLGRKSWEYKQLIACVIASFTSEMVREFIHFKYQTDEKKREKNWKRLQAFIGRSVSNEWSRDIFPKVIVKKPGVGEQEIACGYKSEKSVHKLSLYIALPYLEDADRADQGDIEEKLGQWFKDTDIVAVLEAVDMFCIRRSDNGYTGMDFECAIGHPTVSNVYASARTPSTSDDVLHINSVREDFCLDMMAFVVRSMDSKRQITTLHQKITTQLANALAVYFKWTEDEDKKIWLRDLVKRLVRTHARLKTEQDCIEAAFPFYNVDMAYNIIKRIRNSQKGRYIQPEQILKEIDQLYWKIEDRLCDEKKRYQAAGEDKDPGYVEIFNRCPYIKLVRRISSEAYKEEHKNTPEILTEALLQMAKGSEPEETSDN